MHRDIDAGTWKRDGVGALVFGETVTEQWEREFSAAMKRSRVIVDPFEQALNSSAPTRIRRRRRG